MAALPAMEAPTAAPLDTVILLPNFMMICQNFRVSSLIS